MLTATVNSPANDQPLTPVHYRELALAQTRTKAIRRAARVANFNGWTTAVLAVLSAPFALFSVVGFVMTVGLCIVAFNEFRGRKRLLDFNPSSAALLGWNQIGLLALIAGYSLWMCWAGMHDGGALTAELRASPELTDVLGSVGDIEHLYKQVSLAFYGSVVALTVIVQGLTAAYYFSRRKHVEVCLHDTPAWALDLERMTTHA